jgi:hypothetical protein
MDWKSLTSKLEPYISKAKDAGYKALDFTQKQLQNTPVVLKTLEEYTNLRGSKRVVLFAYDESDMDAKNLLLRSPIWTTQAWGDAAEFRLVEIHSAPDIARELQIKTPVDMRVWYTGQETFHSTTPDAILEWWKTRCYDGKHDEKSD